MFYTCMMNLTLVLEGKTEYVSLIRTVPYQESTLRFVTQFNLCFLPAQWTPVPTTL